MHVEKGRIGQFFLFVGLILLIILSSADGIGRAEVSVFCLSMLAFALAIFLFWRDWKPPSGSERFRILRRLTRKKPAGKK